MAWTNETKPTLNIEYLVSESLEYLLTEAGEYLITNQSNVWRNESKPTL